MNKECFTEQEVVDLLLDKFYENFAENVSRVIVDHRSVDIIYSLANHPVEWLTDNECQKVLFRAAYVLETIYLRYNEHFAPYHEQFISDFPACSNESAKRHFTKIMAHILTLWSPSLEECCTIADACAQWAIKPRTRVAVVIGSIEVMILLRDQVEWIDEVLEPILEIVARNPSPGMEVRLKRWNKVINISLFHGRSEIDCVK